MSFAPRSSSKTDRGGPGRASRAGWLAECWVLGVALAAGLLVLGTASPSCAAETVTDRDGAAPTIAALPDPKAPPPGVAKTAVPSSEAQPARATGAGGAAPERAGAGPSTKGSDLTPSAEEGKVGQAPQRLTTAREVHDRVDKRYCGDNSKMKLTLVSFNERGEEKREHLIRYRIEKNAAKGQLARTLLCYLSPADVRGTSTLTLQQQEADDLQRIYLPALKKDRRIAAADKGKSWSGTEFSYEDLREQKMDDFEYSNLESDSVDGHDCYRYSATPKAPDKSSYGRIESWVRKDILETVKARYYDKKGRLLKELLFLNLKKIQGIWTPQHLLMVNLQDNRKTDFMVNKVLYNSRLEEGYFTPRAMLQVPDDFQAREQPWGE